MRDCKLIGGKGGTLEDDDDEEEEEEDEDDNAEVNVGAVVAGACGLNEDALTGPSLFIDVPCTLIKVFGWW